ncbi:hypothetical protein CMUS01_07699 [Colletotrichum musicola]|uniref:Uncharacterized protein n=1 Tax=Colletotrichum musicola TaxID=2175873 RepID=A0A8H6NEL6_9PEZI|nr:hypothetical protein CMUS01_07699 [Colletotrichum musicola]
METKCKDYKMQDTTRKRGSGTTTAENVYTAQGPERAWGSSATTNNEQRHTEAEFRKNYSSRSRRQSQPASTRDALHFHPHRARAWSAADTDQEDEWEGLG